MNTQVSTPRPEDPWGSGTCRLGMDCGRPCRRSLASPCQTPHGTPGAPTGTPRCKHMCSSPPRTEVCARPAGFPPGGTWQAWAPWTGGTYGPRGQCRSQTPQGHPETKPRRQPSTFPSPELPQAGAHLGTSQSDHSPAGPGQGGQWAGAGLPPPAGPWLGRRRVVPRFCLREVLRAPEPIGIRVRQEGLSGTVDGGVAGPLPVVAPQY